MPIRSFPIDKSGTPQARLRQTTITIMNLTQSDVATITEIGGWTFKAFYCSQYSCNNANDKKLNIKQLTIGRLLSLDFYNTNELTCKLYV